MPLASYSHDEPGEQWIVRTPDPEFSGKRLFVTFIDGEARTQYMDKAREFSEIYNYEVIPYTGAPTWDVVPEVSETPGARAEWQEESSSLRMVKEKPLGRPEGQMKPRMVKDEINEDRAFRKAIAVD